VNVYMFQVPAAGKYVIALKGRRDMEGECAGAAIDECNDVFTKVDAGEFHKTMIKGAWGEWIWEARLAEAGALTGPAIYDLASGRHVLHLAGRSARATVDAIAIYPAGATPPYPKLASGPSILSSPLVEPR
jgi:hypothetical protein